MSLASYQAAPPRNSSQELHLHYRERTLNLTYFAKGVKNAIGLANRSPCISLAVMEVRLTILGSGSAGNCALVESSDVSILVDAGLSGRHITERLGKVGRRVSDLDAILLTHEHTDHTKGLNILCNHHHLPIYCNRPTAEAIAPTLPKFSRWHFFTTGHAFEIGDLGIEPFSVPHDAQDPVGFVVRANGAAIAFVTDLGHATKLVVERVRTTNVLVIETNHDIKMLQEARRPWSLKQRIMGRHGHLSNEEAARVVGEVASDRLHTIFLAHLSRDCNRPALALETVSMQLEKVGARSVAVRVALQDQITPPWEL